MNSINHMHTDPVAFPRTRRNHMLQVLTSLPAGKAVPLAAIPLLREDGLSASARINVEMLETKELLVNPVDLRITAFVVPHLALTRFDGSRDQFDRSYMGQPNIDGGTVVPFIETQAYGTFGSNLVYKYLGLHGQSADNVNTAYLEAYNLIYNFRAKNRSKNLAARTRLQTDLAPAFWQHGRFQHIVPDFDQAVIDGEVALNVVNNQLTMSGTAPVVGIGLETGSPAVANAALRYTNGVGPAIDYATDPTQWGMQVQGAAGSRLPAIYTDLANVRAELLNGGITLSLSNLELARQTQAFAKLRERYDGIADEYLIDMMMDGLEIPDQALKNPILLFDRTVNFAQAKRYSSTAGSMAESAVSGGASMSINIRVPRLNTGGVVMILAECVPQQLFERQRDPYFYAGNTRVDGELVDFPAALRDTLDPEKVDVVKNGEIDTAHATPNGTFGYGPMNGKWNMAGPKVGGKFIRPTTDAPTDTVRQRIWAVEKLNPALSADFYVVSSMHLKPFLDTVSDPFEASVSGNAVIDGLTQFGGVLVESATNYDKVMEKAPTERIAK